MLASMLLGVGSVVIILWGIAHALAVKSVVAGFGQISKDNRRILVMEWIAEGLALCFIGSLVLAVTVSGGTQNPVSIIVYRLSALMLVIMAVLTLLTGARIKILPMKICPVVKIIVAALFFFGSL